MKKILSFLVFAGLLVSSMMVQAAKTDDIRIVIDVSGSMLKTDPNNLRVPALRLITGLMPTGAKAGVWTFGRYVNMEVKWGTVDDRWRKRAEAGADKIHSRGQFTNIEGALARASSGWKKSDPNTQRSLILLTDGKVDISRDANKNQASRQKIIDRSIPMLIERGIKVYTIALSDQTDEELLRLLALKTSGSFEKADNAKDLQRIFLRMFERAAKPDTVPLNGNRFTIDKSVREMTLLVFRSSDKKTQLHEPGGTRHQQSEHGRKVKWRVDQGYDLITVKKPKAGEWLLDADIDPDNRVMIVTDLTLQVSEIPPYLTPDQSIDLQVELHNQGKKIGKRSFLKFVDFKLLHQSPEKTEELPLLLKKSREIKDKGNYLQKIVAPLTEGKHEIQVQADARTFSRSKRFDIEVQWPVKVTIDPAGKPGVYSIRIEPRTEYIDPESLRLAVQLKDPQGEIGSVKIEKSGSAWLGEARADQHDGLHQLMVSMQASNTDGETVQHDLQPYPLIGAKFEMPAPAEPEKAEVEETTKAQPAPPAAIVNEEVPEPESDWLGTLFILGGFNLLLIVSAIGVWIFIRKRSAISGLETLYEEEKSEESDQTDSSTQQEPKS